MPRILLVEDDPALRSSLRAVLTRGGYDVDVAEDGSLALTAIAAHRHDAILLDIGLPFIDGWRILDGLDARARPPVIVISARGEERDKVRALDLGADDYLAKPFGAEELLARIRAVLRRAQPAAVPKLHLDYGDLVIDLAAGTVHRHGVEVRLSPTEYGLLVQLARHVGAVMDHRTLLHEVWGPAYSDERNYLRTFVQRLRNKLEEDPHHPTVLVTVGTRGYRLETPGRTEVKAPDSPR